MAILTSKRAAFRSGLEERIANQLEHLGVEYGFETEKIKYVKPVQNATYTPDFILPNGLIIEAKGRFLTKDRQKHLMIKKQFPELDIRFVFSNPKNKIGKGSKTSYGDWCDRKGFLYATEKIPTEWIDEKPASLEKSRAPSVALRTT